MSATTTSFSSPVKTSDPPLEGRTASESRKDSREQHLISDIPQNAFSSTYLLDSSANASNDWLPYEQELVEEIKGTSVGDEKSMYNGFAPLLRLLNSISKRVFHTLGNPNAAALVFSTSDKKQLQDPFSNQRRFPDVIATWEMSSVLDQQTAPNDHLPLLDNPKAWSGLATVGEAKVNADGRYQLANYLRDLLRNHPELNAVLGLAARATGYEFLYHNACVIYRSGHFAWTAGPMRAFVRRLYSRPFEDVSSRILRVAGRTSWATKIGQDVFVSQSSRPEPGPGQRRFTTLAIHMLVGFCLFIKDVWRDSRRRFFEPSLYAKAHQGQPLAGLMSVAHSGHVVDEDGQETRTTDIGPGPEGQATIVRYKMRITTRDIGGPLEGIRSLRQLLCVMYDACVVQRNLWRKARILHRDISDGNIMVAPDTEEYRERCAAGYADVKFVNQILSRDENAKPKPACLVIDLGNGADTEATDCDEQVLAERTGTPKFIARSVSCGKLLAFKHYRSDLTFMPKLAGTSLDLYLSTNGTRYQEYNKLIDEGPHPAIPSSLKFKHQLFHDAESTFWVLAWILARSAKEGYTREEEWTPQFEAFTTVMREHYPSDRKIDGRLALESTEESWEKIFHPDLASLSSMVAEMHDYIRPEWAHRNTPDLEHAHEALMRLMLKEIVRIDESGIDIPLAVGVRSLPGQHMYASARHSQSATSLFPALPQSRSQSKKSLEPLRSASVETAPPGSSGRSRKRSGSHLADQSAPRRSPRLGAKLESNPAANTGGADMGDPLIAAAKEIKWEQASGSLRDPEQGGTHLGLEGSSQS